MLLFLLLQSALGFADIASGANNYNSYNPDSYDVCKTQYTYQHYMNGECVEVIRPIVPGSPEIFKLRSVIITEKDDAAKNYPTLIMIPGGPGESSGMLRYALNMKDMLNGIAAHMDMRVVLYDPRGTGTSLLSRSAEKYEKSVFSEARLVDDLSALADAVSPDRPVVLLAHSAGGATALKYAQLNPNRVSKIVLASTSVSPRHMGQLNLMQYAKEPLLWNNYLKNAGGTRQELAELNRKYLFIEDVLVQQLKAKVLKKDANPKVRQTPLEIRAALIAAINTDASGAAVRELVNRSYAELKDIEEAGGVPLVTADLRKLKIEDDPKVYGEKFKKGEWIKVAVMCGEGMTPEEASKDSFFDGLKMSWFCNNFSTTTPVDIDLTSIQTPVLFFTGLNDSIIPLAEAERVVKTLPNAQLIKSAKAGHAVFLDDAPTFYFGMEGFLEQ